VFVVGHDWGAQVAWHLCLLRPDRVRAVVGLGVPYFPRAPRPMAELFATRGDGFYMTQFQVPIVILAMSASCSCVLVSASNLLLKFTVLCEMEVFAVGDFGE
jgi:pimeloyl-ACP methyl ester carboxylesterase